MNALVSDGPAKLTDTQPHPLPGREIFKMNGAGNAILVLDLRGTVAAGRPPTRARFTPRRVWPMTS